MNDQKCVCGHEKLEHGFDGNCFYLVAPLKVCPCTSFRPAEQKREYTAKLIQDGIEVAAVYTSNIEDCEREIHHYAMQYIQDGPVEIRRSYRKPADPPEKPNMTIEQKIQAIREKCIAANHTIVERHANCKAHGKRGGLFACICKPRPIRLADVLLAITVIMPTTKIDDKELLEFIFMRWNLRADDLNLQTPETINFIYELLK